MSDVVTLVLAGGQGARLYPLTKIRSKPAVPIAGRFRLIDISLSNCLHSGLRKIFILTQFATESLHRHIFLTYRFDEFSRGFLTILSAQQTLENRDWYQGTADAVRQNLAFLKNKGDLVLVLSGDHLYRMDYDRFIDFHIRKKADISVSVTPVTADEAPELGVMRPGRSGRIQSFIEKPKTAADLERLRVPIDVLRATGMKTQGKTHIASMGVYLFNTRVLEELLGRTEFKDFGRDVIPRAIRTHKVYAYLFEGYWRDIGTIRSFYEANLDLTSPLPKFNFYDEKRPIFTHARYLPGSKILASEVDHSILCEGSIINRSRISRSIIGIRSRIGESSVLDRTVVMGADYFESGEEIEANLKNRLPPIGIGRDCLIRGAIIDKNARIGDGVKLVNHKGVAFEETEDYVIRDGIIVVPKHAVIPDGTVV
ncbi:MAG: glucose-1-phosphate adenylyltransferase [Candidatus Aminicenantes bacterium]|jgi:glucose-1-phosphate adenylyltransferase|nr:glucose-1-phosphate adenylyltransferase [Candidatus Aminicenantes bacterium]